jgi:Holliday junction resolvase RusA-like endonuclease
MENKSYIIRLYTVPVAMPRYGRSKKGGVYLPRPKGKREHPAVQFKADLRKEAQDAGIEYSLGPIIIDWQAYFERPKRLSRKKDPAGPIPRKAKPDRDNLDKTILDALEGLAYRNDSQVYAGMIEKYYCAKPELEAEGFSRPQVIIRITQVREDHWQPMI